MPKEPMRDVVVVLPGILGSVLEKDGREVWGLGAGAIMRGVLTRGDSVRALALAGDSSTDLDLGDGVSATRLVDDLHLIPGLWKIDGYTKLRRAIADRLDVHEGQNLFAFPYDWRRDIRSQARALQQRAHGWLRDWRSRAGNEDAKLVLVGHSLGGLVARYFVECLEGWKDTRTTMTFGTPYRGSLDALGYLANGFTKKVLGVTLVDLTELVRTLTTTYQLLPTYTCYDAGNGTVARVGETPGIPGVDAGRAAAALAVYREMDDAAKRNRSDAAYRHRLHLVVGRFQPTKQSARRNGDGLEMLTELEGRNRWGDGTVPTISSIPLEAVDEASELNLFERHSQMQNADTTLVQLTASLSRPDDDLRRYQDAGVLGMGLDIDDVYGADETIAVRIRCEDTSRPLVVETSGGTRVPVPPTGEPERTIELLPAPPGEHRIRVSADAPGVAPVSDVFVVA